MNTYYKMRRMRSNDRFAESTFMIGALTGMFIGAGIATLMLAAFPNIILSPVYAPSEKYMISDNGKTAKIKRVGDNSDD